MTTLRKEKDDFRTNDFRPSFVVDAIATALRKPDPLYQYKRVISDYKHDPWRVERMLDEGWEIVISDQKMLDDRKNTPDNDSDDKLRSTPVTKKTRDGHTLVLMRCLKATFDKLEAAEEKTRQDRLDAMRQHRQRVSGNEVRVTDSEINTDKFL